MKKILILLLAFSLYSTAQTKISLLAAQDARLAIFGDDKGNSPGTINMLFQLKMQGHQQNKGYMIVYPEFVFANLHKINYKHYTVNVGYSFHHFLIEDLEATAAVGYGFIDRSLTSRTYTLSGSLAYNITQSIKLVALGQLTHRSDKDWMYGSDADYTITALKLDFSGYVGLEIDIF